MSSTKTVTVSSGATSVTLSYILANSAYPDRGKNFTEHILEDNSRVRDVVGNTKRRWEFVHDVPLSGSQVTDLETLYALNIPITLTDNFTQSAVAYTVHFEKMSQRLESPDGSARYSFVFQEL